MVHPAFNGIRYFVIILEDVNRNEVTNFEADAPASVRHRKAVEEAKSRMSEVQRISWRDAIVTLREDLAQLEQRRILYFKVRV